MLNPQSQLVLDITLTPSPQVNGTVELNITLTHPSLNATIELDIILTPPRFPQVNGTVELQSKITCYLWQLYIAFLYAS